MIHLLREMDEIFTYFVRWTRSFGAPKSIGDGYTEVLFFKLQGANECSGKHEHHMVILPRFGRL
jgi:hypothetical protein